MNITVTQRMRLAGLVGVVALAMAGTAQATIKNTKHNLSATPPTAGPNDIASDSAEICIFCHTPHSAIKNNSITLWNHTLSTNASYGVYTSPTFDGADIADLGLTGAPDVIAAAAAPSNLCLSCHDGTVGINSINNTSNFNQTTGITMSSISGRLDPTTSALALTDTAGNAVTTNLGTSLMDDHPVNFTYTDAVDATIVPEAQALAAGVKTFGATATSSGKVQCASCHDPHLDSFAAFGAGAGAFLRISMTGSALCLACHDK